MKSEHLTPAVVKVLADLESRKKTAIILGKQMMTVNEGNIYPVDLLAIGAIKRCLCLCAGFKILVEARNLVCARSLLRLQIDTTLRFYSIFLVESPHDLASKVLGGQQINHLKDRNGKDMTDAYLVSCLSLEHPWLTEVYKITSGYIHLSDRHLMSPVHEIDKESEAVEYVISDTDTQYPEFSWIEVIECFTEATDIFLKYLQGWVFTKANPELLSRHIMVKKPL